MFDDISVLKDFGVSFATEKEAEAFLEVLRETLEIRIGSRISEGLSEAELEEFDRITDHREASLWLDKHRPGYGEIARSEIQRMKEEIREYRDRIPGALPPGRGSA